MIEMQDEEIEDIQETIEVALDELNKGNVAYVAADLGSLYSRFERMRETNAEM